MTKATSTAPVTAMTTFLPTMVPHSAITGLLGHTARDFRTGTGEARSVGERPRMAKKQPAYRVAARIVKPSRDATCRYLPSKLSRYRLAMPL